MVTPLDEEWDQAVAKLEESSELLDAFRAGSKLDHLGLELHCNIANYSKQDFLALFPNRDYQEVAEKAKGYSESMGVEGLGQEADKLMAEGLVAIRLPHTQSFRQAARILQVDTRIAVTQNDPDRVVDNTKTMLGFARQHRNENLLVCNLVGVAIFKIAVAQIEEVLRESPGFLQESHLAELQNEIAKADFTRMDFSGERAFQSDLLQRIYTDDGDGDGRLTPEGLEIITQINQWQDGSPDSGTPAMPWTQANPVMRSILGPAMMLSAPGRKETTEMNELLSEEAESRFGTPWWEDDFSELKEMSNVEDPSITPVISAHWPSIHASYQFAIAHQDAGILGIAIERYRLKFDSWPQSMNDLTGRFLKTQPLDRLTGKALRFNASDEGVTIYSVGGDLDDDGGKHDKRTYPLHATLYDKTVDGDFVLWPIDRD